MGIFPMAQSRDDPQIHWVDPRRRGIFPLDGFVMSRSLSRTIRRNRFDVRVDTDFTGVVEGCADRDDTWINTHILWLYRRLHAMGRAHSVELWQGSRLVGGVYGVVLGAAFFGESMFSRERDASKIALAWLIHRLRAGGFKLFDTQFLTPHLASLGAIEITRADYHRRLQDAISTKATFYPAGYAPYPSLISSMGASSVSGASSISGATKPESQDKSQMS